MISFLHLFTVALQILRSTILTWRPTFCQFVCLGGWFLENCVIYNQDNLVLSSGFLSDWADSLRRRANTQNVSFRIPLRWPIHIINIVDKAKLSCNTNHRRSTTASLENYPLLFIYNQCQWRVKCTIHDLQE